MKIVVAMSGGVDSSLAAALLTEEGHDVSGIALRVYDSSACGEGGEKTCCSARDIRDARRVAAALDIPFSSWDIRDEFAAEVIAPFAQEYLAGRTPNPCVLCNSRIKFRLLLGKVRELGADRLATGHYARIEGAAEDSCLALSADAGKDQTYFLFEIGARALGAVLFPLGGMTKAEVRREAARRGLPVAAKRESQEICFVPGNDYGRFLGERFPSGTVRPGPILDGEGRALGTHRGLMHYTVGQRRGLGISSRRPLYVRRLDRERNALIVGSEEDLMTRRFTVRDLCWYGGHGGRPFRADVRIRYRHRPAPALLAPGDAGEWQVEFDAPQRAVTPGQAAVFYTAGRVAGGGWIDGIAAG